MGFKSVNEIEEFRYDDCVIAGFEVNENRINLILEALIVRKNNSQNANFTESYAGTTNLTLNNANIVGGVKDGYKFYDANEVLLKEVPDQPLAEDEIKELIGRCEGAYLYDIDKKDIDNGMKLTLSVEFVDEEENTMADSYQLHITCESATFSWEHYMNRVQS